MAGRRDRRAARQGGGVDAGGRQLFQGHLVPHAGHRVRHPPAVHPHRGRRHRQRQALRPSRLAPPGDRLAAPQRGPAVGGLPRHPHPHRGAGFVREDRVAGRGRAVHVGLETDVGRARRPRRRLPPGHRGDQPDPRPPEPSGLAGRALAGLRLVAAGGGPRIRLRHRPRHHLGPSPLRPRPSASWPWPSAGACSANPAPSPHPPPPPSSVRPPPGPAPSSEREPPDEHDPRQRPPPPPAAGPPTGTYPGCWPAATTPPMPPTSTTMDPSRPSAPA